MPWPPRLALGTFGVGIASDFIDGGDTPFSLFDFYDQAGIALNVVSVLVTIATGVLWVVWQFHAAKHAIGQTRRSPGWHAGSWFIPVVGLWFPYQNISDLWRAFGRIRPSWLILWWLLWLASAFVMQISARVSLAAEDLETLRIAMALASSPSCSPSPPCRSPAWSCAESRSSSSSALQRPPPPRSHSADHGNGCVRSARTPRRAQ